MLEEMMIQAIWMFKSYNLGEIRRIEPWEYYCDEKKFDYAATFMIEYNVNDYEFRSCMIRVWNVIGTKELKAEMDKGD